LGAVGSSYTLGDSDVNTDIAVVVSFKDDHGNDEGPLTSISVGPIENVNDEPSGADKTISVAEDTAVIIAASEFGFSDPIDNDDFHSVVIASIPTAGELSLDGIAVTVDQIIPIADISAGLLVYTPPANVSGTNSEGFSFYVRDDGGELHNGVNTDQSQNFISFDLQGINDAPLIVAGIGSVDEGESTIVGIDTLNAIDPDDDQPGELSFALLTQPEHGQLFIGEELVTSETSFTLAAIQQNQFKYVHNGSETSTDSFDIQVSDGGEDGVDAATGSVTILINEVIDPAPAIPNETLQLSAGQLFSSQDGDTLLDSGETVLAAQQLFDNPNLTVSLVTPPLYGTLTLTSDGSFSYQHHGGLELQDSFEFLVTNEDNVSTLATVTILIEPPVEAANQGYTSDIGMVNIADASPQPSSESSGVVQTSTAQFNNAIDMPAPKPQPGTTESVESGILTELNQSQRVVYVLEKISVIQHNRVNVDIENIEQPLSSADIDFEGELYTTASNRDYALFLEGLNKLDSQLKQADELSKQRYALAQDTALGVSISVTAGMIAWLLRGGALLGSVLSTTPLWKGFDPVYVYTGKQETDEDDDEVEEYFSDDSKN